MCADSSACRTIGPQEPSQKFVGLVQASSLITNNYQRSGLCFARSTVRGQSNQFIPQNRYISPVFASFALLPCYDKSTKSTACCALRGPKRNVVPPKRLHCFPGEL